MDTSNASSIAWSFVEKRSDDKQPQSFELADTSFTVGRTNDANVVLDSLVVSKVHALLGVDNGKPFVQDLNSTNGTFVNGKPVQAVELNDGDNVRFANLIFVVESKERSKPDFDGTVTWTTALLQFEQLMDPGGVVPHYQPVVRLSDRQTVGFECLSRSGLERLDSPEKMFTTADELGQAQDLSEAMRIASMNGVSDFAKVPGTIFLNTHPSEAFSFRLEQSLRELRRSAPNVEIAIEVTEEVASDQEKMVKFRALLQELSMKLVYDNFGADQERLVQIVQLPPDYLKFDSNLIRGIDASTDRNKELVRSLVDAVHRIGVTSLAFGIESAAEADTCAALGFQLAQGFHFGRPESFNSLVKQTEPTESEPTAAPEPVAATQS